MVVLAGAGRRGDMGVEEVGGALFILGRETAQDPAVRCLFEKDKRVTCLLKPGTEGLQELYCSRYKLSV